MAQTQLPQAPQVLTGSRLGSVKTRPDSNGLVEFESANKIPRRCSAGGAGELRQRAPGSFKTKCWECHYGRFASRRNSRRRCREVYCHVGPDWASSATLTAGSRPHPEQCPTSAAAGDGGAPCAANAGGHPSPAEKGADTAPTAVSGPKQRTLCWVCNRARLHASWRHCREVLRHTAPDLKTWIAVRRRRGADAADDGCGRAERTVAGRTAEAEPCPGPSLSGPHGLGAEEPRQVVQVQQTTSRHCRPAVVVASAARGQEGTDVLGPVSSPASARKRCRPTPRKAWLFKLRAVPCRRAAAAAEAAALASAALASASLDYNVSYSCSLGAEDEEHNNSDYLPGSNEQFKSESASKDEPRGVCVGDACEQLLSLTGSGPGSFKTKCWECHFGRFARHKNSRGRCREVYGHVGPDWASQAARTRPLPEELPPSAADGDGEAPCASNAIGCPSPAERADKTTPTVVSRPRQRTLCWKCSKAHSHKGWRHCRQILWHTAPDIKTWIAAHRRRGADAAAAADGCCCMAKMTAEAEPCTQAGPSRSSPDCLGAEEPSQVVQLQQTTSRHCSLRSASFPSLCVLSLHIITSRSRPARRPAKPPGGVQPCPAEAVVAGRAMAVVSMWGQDKATTRPGCSPASKRSSLSSDAGVWLAGVPGGSADAFAAVLATAKSPVRRCVVG